MMIIPLRLVDDERIDWLPPAEHLDSSNFNELKIQYLPDTSFVQKDRSSKEFQLRGIDVFWGN